MSDLATSLLPITSRVRTDVSARKTKKGMFWTDEPLDKQRLREHVFSGLARGVCPIKAGESTTRLALLDLDSHKGETSWKEMVRIAQRIIVELERHGAKVIPFRSSGGKGIHLFLIWDDPQDAYSVRKFLAGILGTLGYKNGTAGVSNGEIEIFPKQDSVRDGGYGNQFILPLAGKSVPLRASPLVENLYVGKREDALKIVWETSSSVPVLEKPVPTARPVRPEGYAPDLKLLRELLSYIDPFHSYDLWFKTGMAIHNETDGSAEGLSLWDEWSAGNV